MGVGGWACGQVVCQVFVTRSSACMNKSVDLRSAERGYRHDCLFVKIESVETAVMLNFGKNNPFTN